MRFEITRDSAELASSARSFLAARLEHNVLATVLDNVLQAERREDPTGADLAPTGGLPLFAVGSEPASGEVIAAALRTTPWPMLATGFEDPTHAFALLDWWLACDPALNEFGAEPATANALIRAWQESTGGRTECIFREALHSLTTVTDPRDLARGRLREATGEDRDLLIQW